jgi:hypothetical protein
MVERCMANKNKPIKPKIKATSKAVNTFAFTRANYFTLLAGLVVIAIGYVALRLGSITLAPLLLVLGYCVIIPVGILLRPRKQKEQPRQPSPDR